MEALVLTLPPKDPRSKKAPVVRSVALLPTLLPSLRDLSVVVDASARYGHGPEPSWSAFVASFEDPSFGVTTLRLVDGSDVPASHRLPKPPRLPPDLLSNLRCLVTLEMRDATLDSASARALLLLPRLRSVVVHAVSFNEHVDGGHEPQSLVVTTATIPSFATMLRTPERGLTMHVDRSVPAIQHDWRWSDLYLDVGGGLRHALARMDVVPRMTIGGPFGLPGPAFADAFSEVEGGGGWDGRLDALLAFPTPASMTAVGGLLSAARVRTLLLAFAVGESAPPPEMVPDWQQPPAAAAALSWPPLSWGRSRETLTTLTVGALRGSRCLDGFADRDAMLASVWTALPGLVDLRHLTTYGVPMEETAWSSVAACPRIETVSVHGGYYAPPGGPPPLPAVPPALARFARECERRVVVRLSVPSDRVESWKAALLGVCAPSAAVRIEVVPF